MVPSRTPLSIAISLALALAPAWAMAQARGDALSETVRMVERDSRGEVLSAERVQYDGRDMHRVKVVENDGRVRVYLREPTSQPARQAPPPPPQDPSRERRNGRGNP